MQVVADYSCLVTGAVSKVTKDGEVVIPLSVIALLESEMRHNKADGFVGTKELLTLKDMANKGTIELRFTGDRPRYISRDAADWDARGVAQTENITLMTCDKVQEQIATALGIQVGFVKQEEHLNLTIQKFFDEKTMSVHVKDHTRVHAKKGKPGAWEFMPITEKDTTLAEVEDMAREIVEKAERNPLAFIEVDKEGATVVQYEDYRIVITRHPFSKGTEITAVHPVRKMTLDEYDLKPELMERFEERAEGIFVAGAPGAGKTTFAQALAEFYSAKKKIVKTIEHPRDLSVNKLITQYGHLEGDPGATGEVLLLVRPDFTVYDELRTTRDFEVYSDMRLAGVGMIGVAHASRAIDAVQRFLGRLEMGVIPQVLDTVIYLRGGAIEKVYELEMLVKVPSGMMEADLARPVVEVKDFFTKKVEFEIYTYGEETTIIPVKESKQDPMMVLAGRELRRVLKKEISGSNIDVSFTGERSAIIYVDQEVIPGVIGKRGRNIEVLEKKLGLKLDVQDIANIPKEKLQSTGEDVSFEIDENKTSLIFYFDRSMNGRQVNFVSDGQVIFSPVVSKKGKVKVARDTDVGKLLADVITHEKELRVTV
ncbi:MAG: Flp pilus assembly complex ATPase component TadA [Candidatus Altiarchaeota archaeon]|nr:Flp pilus assembly complex ATPase component TadA [Candidatus Altiarchaeota archaeon]